MITFNDFAGLDRSLRSLTRQPADWSEVEVVIVNGGEDVRPILPAEAPFAIELISEPDRGVYDAMRKGVETARGEYVWFLNGGDESLLSDQHFDFIRRCGPSALAYFAFEHHYGTTSRIRKPKPPVFIRHSLPTSHQAIVYPRQALLNVISDPLVQTSKVAGDYAMTALMIEAGVTARVSTLPISRFHAGGLSAQDPSRLEAEALRVQDQVFNRSALGQRVSRIVFALSHRRLSSRLRRREEHPISDLSKDVARYGPLPWLLQPALYAVAVYRFGRWIQLHRQRKLLLNPVHFAAYSLVRLAVGIDIPKTAIIGPGLLIHHFGGIVFNPLVRAGSNLEIRHGVTLGNRRGIDDTPTIGDGVTLGAYSAVLGNVHVGDGATVGAHSLVLHDVAPGSVVYGVPARPRGGHR
jgi:serine O-acetyltransferase